SILCDELQKISELSRTIFSNHKMDLGKTKLYLTPVSVYDFIYSEISALMNAYPKVDFELDMDVVGERDIDEVQFRQVIQNLLGNALKFIPDKDGKIRVVLRKQEGKIRIAIEDNGKGFSGVHIDNIFDKYSTGDQGTTGLGMGLYLCKRIVELHGGKIFSANSKKLGGAKFSIEF
ncbi:HAMP domain-containing histidine kinase, partial [Candidatus Gracilibacteria bacterium]|nr:HAMP domain-containing histidine kinase [Candidatus Gracilibacteria bacterium]